MSSEMERWRARREEERRVLAEHAGDPARAEKELDAIRGLWKADEKEILRREASKAYSRQVAERADRERLARIEEEIRREEKARLQEEQIARDKAKARRAQLVARLGWAIALALAVWILADAVGRH